MINKILFFVFCYPTLFAAVPEYKLNHCQSLTENCETKIDNRNFIDARHLQSQITSKKTVSYVQKTALGEQKIIEIHDDNQVLKYFAKDYRLLSYCRNQPIENDQSEQLSETECLELSE